MNPAFDVTSMIPLIADSIGMDGSIVVAILQIIGINILLSGDNAVVIALACRSLPAKTRTLGIWLGVLVAIGLRVIFTMGLQAILDWPWLSLIGGLLLLVIAIQLVSSADHDDREIADSRSLWGAVWTIAVADVVMSLDNVLAIAAVAHGQPWLVFLGLAMSIPLIVGGATLILGLLSRFPILVWAGGALLGWVAGGLLAKEPMLQDLFRGWAAHAGLAMGKIEVVLGSVGAVLVVVVGLALARMKAARVTGR